MGLCCGEVWGVDSWRFQGCCKANMGSSFSGCELMLWKISVNNLICDWQEGLLVTSDNVSCHNLYSEMSMMTKAGNTRLKLKKQVQGFFFFFATQGDYFSSIIMDWIEDDVIIIVIIIVLEQQWSCFLGEGVVIVECDGQ